MEYEMTQADLDAIIEACRPVPLIMLQCGMPRSQQENANAAWQALGSKMGFDYMSVRPSSRGNRFFTAEPSPVQAKGIPQAKEKLLNLMCPKCGGELISGIFIGKEGEYWSEALHCKPCNWVWEKP